MTSLSDDLRSALDARGNALRRLLLYNGAVFVVLAVTRTVLTLAGHAYWYGWLYDHLALPADPGTLLTRPWALLTYAFSHDDFWHVLFNLLNLYYFGSLIQEYVGQRRLVSLYLLGALAGGAVYILAVQLIPYLHPLRGGNLIGASGGVTAIIVGAATLLPNYTFQLFLLGSVRIKWIAAVLVLLSVIRLTGGNAGGEFAHLGGAAMGFAFIRALQAGNDLGRPVVAVGNWFSGLFRSRPPMRVSYRQPAVRPGTPIPAAGRVAMPATPEQEEVDRILDKISRSGYESLSKEEKQQLFRASQK